jgi:hypothetical protein
VKSDSFAYSSTQNMKAVLSSETPVILYQTARLHISKPSDILHRHQHNNVAAHNYEIRKFIALLTRASHWASRALRQQIHCMLCKSYFTSFHLQLECAKCFSFRFSDKVVCCLLLLLLLLFIIKISLCCVLFVYVSFSFSFLHVLFLKLASGLLSLHVNKLIKLNYYYL